MKKFVRNQTFLVVFVFLFAFGVRLHYVFQKEEFHVDEVLSVILASYNKYGWNMHYDEDKIYTGKEVRKLTFFEDSSIKSALYDVNRLRKDNRDGPHTNLYYSCLRFWFAGTQTSDSQRIIVQSCLLNLLFFTFSFLFLYKLIRILFSNKWLSCMALAVAFLNTGSISTTMLIRPYQLQETLFIIFVYLFAHLYQKINLKQAIDSWKNLLIIALVTALTLLSGYFAVLFILLFGIVLVYKLYKEKQSNNINFIICSFIVALIFAFAAYQKYEKGFFDHRAGEAVGKITDTVIDNIYRSSIEFLSILHKHLFYTPIIVFVCLSMMYIIYCQRKSRKIRCSQLLSVILLISFLWAAAIMILAPYKVYRYIAPTIPLLALFITGVVAHFRSSKIIFTAMSFCVAIYGYTAFCSDKIEFLYKGKKQAMAFNQKPEIPVIVRVDHIWKLADVVSCFPDEQYYIFPHSDKVLAEKINEREEVFVLMENNNFMFPENYLKTELPSSALWFSVYYLVRK